MGFDFVLCTQRMYGHRNVPLNTWKFIVFEPCEKRSEEKRGKLKEIIGW